MKIPFNKEAEIRASPPGFYSGWSDERIYISYLERMYGLQIQALEKAEGRIKEAHGNVDAFAKKIIALHARVYSAGFWARLCYLFQPESLIKETP
jgi:hypothetical protein